MVIFFSNSRPWLTISRPWLTNSRHWLTNSRPWLNTLFSFGWFSMQSVAHLNKSLACLIRKNSQYIWTHTCRSCYITYMYSMYAYGNLISAGDNGLCIHIDENSKPVVCFSGKIPFLGICHFRGLIDIQRLLTCLHRCACHWEEKYIYVTLVELFFPD
jgi:hypothetical protein